MLRVWRSVSQGRLMSQKQPVNGFKEPLMLIPLSKIYSSVFEKERVLTAVYEARMC